jgi:hypothetical protein
MEPESPQNNHHEERNPSSVATEQLGLTRGWKLGPQMPTHIQPSSLGAQGRKLGNKELCP